MQLKHRHPKFIGHGQSIIPIQSDLGSFIPAENCYYRCSWSQRSRFRVGDVKVKGDFIVAAGAFFYHRSKCHHLVSVMNVIYRHNRPTAFCCISVYNFCHRYHQFLSSSPYFVSYEIVRYSEIQCHKTLVEKRKDVQTTKYKHQVDLLNTGLKSRINQLCTRTM